MQKNNSLPDGWYVAQCIDIRACDGTDLSRGGSVWLRRLADCEVYKYHLPSLSRHQGHRSGILPLINLCHGFDYPFEFDQPYDHKLLVGRHAEILIKHELRAGRFVPIIVQFRQSPVQWFKWKGDSNAD